MARGISSRARGRWAAAVAPITAPTSLKPHPRTSPSPSTSVARRSHSRTAAGQLEVLEVGGARVRRPHEHEHAGAARDERLQRVAAEQRVGGEGVGAEARHLAGERGGCAGERLRVGGGGRAGSRRACRRRSRAGRPPVPGNHRVERRPAGRAEPLEARELRLDRHARRPGRPDQQPAVLEHRARRALGDGAPALGGARGGGPQPRPDRDRCPSTICDSRRVDRVAEALRERRAQRTARSQPLAGSEPGTAVVSTSIRSPVRGLTPRRPV